MVDTNATLDKSKDGQKASKEPKYLEVTNIDYETFQAMAKMSPEDRNAAIAAKTKSSWTKDEVLKKTKMTWMEEIVAVCTFCFGVPGAAFSVPAILLGAGILTGSIVRSFLIGMAVLAPLAFLPSPFQEKSLSSWWALQILRYFSFKVIYEEQIQDKKPYILVAPPHGVFPFGNIVTMMAFPSVYGFSFRGLAASAALTFPIFRQLLCTIGAISASKGSALKVKYSILLVLVQI